MFYLHFYTLSNRCKRQVKRVRNGQVEQLHDKVELVGATPDFHEPRIGYAVYSRDHALVLPRNLLLAIRRPSNNILMTVHV